ncbi:MAG: isoprenyl transferase [Peptostreptococcaceae bacterium]|nr:isoprenyl transferase [Peptostreptococcaceae bacterium]
MDENLKKIPTHIGIIMDGNGRWAKSRGLIRTQGHKMGVEALKVIVEECSDLGVKYLTAYAFSTENWKREATEVSAIMKLIEIYLKSELKKMMANGVRFRTIGELSALPENIQKVLYDSIEETKNNTGLTLTIALNYGGRDDIRRAVQKICRRVKEGELQPDEITQKLISEHLDTHFMPDPDLVIRPSGELRLSNFLLWESAYSEFWYSDINWPDFKPEDLRKAIISYQERDRRFGNAK